MRRGPVTGTRSSSPEGAAGAATTRSPRGTAVCGQASQGTPSGRVPERPRGSNPFADPGAPGRRPATGSAQPPAPRRSREGAHSRAGLRLLGVDFTSAPRAAKPITVAHARLWSPSRADEPARFELEALQSIAGFEGFESLLASPGPWVGGFDFPFGLPREAVVALGWPCEWRALVGHCEAIGREAFRTALDRHRETRPWGARYEHRAGDRAAGSHSPLKLVNPPVGLMFLEGAPRLARAGVHLPGLAGGDPSRVALEAYPGHWVRQQERESYKSDTPAKQTPARAAARGRIVAALLAGASAPGLRVELPAPLARTAVEDASGDTLDAIVCALQAALAALQAGQGWGLPAEVDPIEGWITGVRPLSPEAA